MNTLLAAAFAIGLLLGSSPNFETAISYVTILGFAAIVAADYGREARARVISDR